jgi:hypothetical protein
VWARGIRATVARCFCATIVQAPPGARFARSELRRGASGQMRKFALREKITECYFPSRAASGMPEDLGRTRPSRVA